MDKETLDYMLKHMPTSEDIIKAHEKYENDMKKAMEAYDDMNTKFKEYRTRIEKQGAE